MSKTLRGSGSLFSLVRRWAQEVRLGSRVTRCTADSVQANGANTGSGQIERIAATGDSRLRAALVAGYCCVAAISAAVIPLGFLVWLMNYDALSYFLMAQNAAHTGISTARLAVNLPPITYAPGPGYVYAPIMLVFQSFDWRIRAIEILNAALYGVFFALSLRYLARVAPQRIRSFGLVAYALATLVRGTTVTAVLLPNADTIPALACLAAFFVVSDTDFDDAKKLAIVTLISVPVFFIKMSVAILPLALVILMLARNGSSVQEKLRLRAIAAAGATIVVILLLLNAKTVSYYLGTIWTYYDLGAGHSSVFTVLLTICAAVLSLVLGALPEAIVPNFQFNFLASARYESMSGLNYAFSFKSALAASVSILIFALIVFGAVRLWRTRKYDLLVLLLSLPVFALAANSTPRYLIGFHPMLWSCFLVAVAPVFDRLRGNHLFAVAASIVIAVVLLFTANSYLAMRSKSRGSLRNPAGVLDYLADVERVGEDFRTRLRSLAGQGASAIYLEEPHDRAQVWLSAANIPSYDIANVQVLPHRGLILALACRSPWCGQMPAWRAEVSRRLAPQCLTLTLRNRWQTPSAAAEISDVTTMPHCDPSAEDVGNPGH